MKTLVATPVLGEPIAAEWRAWGRTSRSGNGAPSGGLLRIWQCLGLLPARPGSIPRTGGEDGLLGISDEKQRLCFALALWNGADPILKERLFGLTGSEGNHGEDVKEYYWYLDATPTHSYLRGLYKYPQRTFPYADLSRRTGGGPGATGVRADRHRRLRRRSLLRRRGGVRQGRSQRPPHPDHGDQPRAGPAPLHLLPTLWFRNTWAWGYDDRRPELRAVRVLAQPGRAPGPWWPARAGQPPRPRRLLARLPGNPDLLFTENESNAQRLWGGTNRTPYVKDGIGEAVVGGTAGRSTRTTLAPRRRPTTCSRSPRAQPRRSWRLESERNASPLHRRRADLRRPHR